MTSLATGGPKYIDQRLNVCYRDVRNAVLRRDSEVIARLARQQVTHGANALDLCCAGCDDEIDALVWLAQAVQASVDVTLCLDSPSADALLTAAPICVRPPIINAVSIVHFREGMVEEIACLRASKWIVSTFQPDASVHSPEVRLSRAAAVVDALADVPQSSLILDPLFLPSINFSHAWDESCITGQLLRSRFPEAATLCAVGNVSFGASDRVDVDRDTIRRAVNNGFDWLLCDIATIQQPS